ncbi:PQQ-binding-like beta-propeller repeat protein [Streptomyces sp. NBC_01186]|uniref:outer membrane protein assembly factor BamB family protein n=1 Tax=Streptomyces sp. NBC_01186 TaxID=2903765 RepID=UPI002E117EAC|nr:PQQ-binding-like beta-propeller repeat protein [Streptomyces sp. NBC_01186]
MVEQLTQHDPRRIGPFEVLGRLGAGGMGLVYLARSASGRRVAIKTVRTELAEDQLFRVRFTREVEAARAVSGFYTAAVVDADPRAAVPWLATAYVPSPSLEEIVNECGPLPVQAVRWLAAGVAEALQSIHGAGLVHRDLKPSNVLVVEDGPRVIDFGIASGVSNTRLTMTNVAVGTPAYMSPEQARDSRSVTGASDIFSLASMLVFAATGHAPFHGANPVETVFMLLREGPDLEGLSDDLRPLIESCMRMNAEERPTPADLQSQLAPHLFAAGSDDSGTVSAWLPSTAVTLIERRRGGRAMRRQQEAAQAAQAAQAEQAANAAAGAAHGGHGGPAGNAGAAVGAGAPAGAGSGPADLRGADPSAPAHGAAGAVAAAWDHGIPAGPGGPAAIGGGPASGPRFPEGAGSGSGPGSGGPGPGSASGPGSVPVVSPSTSQPGSPDSGPVQLPGAHVPIGPGPRRPDEGGSAEADPTSGWVRPPNGAQHAAPQPSSASSSSSQAMSDGELPGQAGGSVPSHGEPHSGQGAGQGPRHAGAPDHGSPAPHQAPGPHSPPGVGPQGFLSGGGPAASGASQAAPPSVHGAGSGLSTGAGAGSGPGPGLQEARHPLQQSAPAQPVQPPPSSPHAPSVSSASPVAAGQPGQAGAPQRWRPWRFRMSNDVWGSPVVAEDLVYVTSFEVHALDVASGRRQFKTREVAWSMAVSGGRVHASDGPSLYALDASDGSERWRLATDGWVYSLKVDRGTIVTGTRGGGVQAWEAASGEKLWELSGAQADFETPEGGPVIADGAVYTWADGRLYALEARTGTERWSYPVGDTSATGGVPVRITVAEDGVAYVCAGSRVFALDAATGAERWRFDAPAAFLCPPAYVRGPGVTGGGIYLADYLGTVYALDTGNGHDRWRIATEARHCTEPVVTADGLVHLGSGSALYTLDAVSGTPRWRFATGADVVGAPVVANGRVHFGSADHCLYTVDAVGGQLRWKLATGGEITGPPVVVGGVVYACSKDRCVYALDATKGTGQSRHAS